MKIRKPDYYDRFRCIAGACSDSCCIGWEIDVDDDKRDEYKKVSGELGDRLRSCIDWEEGHFILQGKEERCPFLNSENLCDLILGLGEGSLCEICREHPRFYEWYDDLTEVGVGLCCEAAARLVLERAEPAKFVEVEETDVQAMSAVAERDDETQETDTDDTLNVLFSARETAYMILQNRNESIWNRLRMFLSYIDELQEALDFENLDEIEESAKYYLTLLNQGIPTVLTNPEDRIDAYNRVIAFCRGLEPIDEFWPKRLDHLEKMLADSVEFFEAEQKMLDSTNDRVYEYEHLAVYFVFRYFMKCRVDLDVYSKGALAVFCIMLIRLLDVDVYMKHGTLSKEDRVMNAKDCSKEIEYSEENLEILAELFWKHGFDVFASGL